MDNMYYEIAYLLIHRTGNTFFLKAKLYPFEREIKLSHKELRAEILQSKTKPIQSTHSFSFLQSSQ